MKYIITAIICTIIITTWLMTIQVNKQNSIERQKQMQIDQDNKKLEFEQEQIDLANEEKETNKLLLSYCLQGADDKYFEYAEMNWTKNDDWTITAYNSVWSTAQDIKDKAIDICFKKYK